MNLDLSAAYETVDLTLRLKTSVAIQIQSYSHGSVWVLVFVTSERRDDPWFVRYMNY